MKKKLYLFISLCFFTGWAHADWSSAGRYQWQRSFFDESNG
jgi:hypothetical protein